MDFVNKKVLVIGAGISGFAAAKVTKKFGANVTLSDSKPEDELKFNFDELRELNINLAFGKQDESLLENIDLVILSPSVPVKIPIVQTALAKNISVISEIELAYDLSRVPICAITGTNGKTTTTTLLELLLSKNYNDVGIGGNIGIPLSEVAIENNSIIVAEISSYQLEATNKFKPYISAVLNVTPDHLKRHGDMKTYQAMKEKIFANCTHGDYLVLNYDDENVREMKSRTKCEVYYFSRKVEVEQGAFVKNNILTIRDHFGDTELCTVDELGIKGGHNVENALAASVMAHLAGIDKDDIIEVLKSFKGVEHRIEFVREIDGVKYYNDSKATNPDSAIKALETFDNPIILIAGGYDKLTDVTEFFKLVAQKVEFLILTGDATERFKIAAVQNGFFSGKIFDAGYSMERAVEIANAVATAQQIVLLSPACSSFDMYNSFEERGNDFKRIVSSL